MALPIIFHIIVVCKWLLLERIERNAGLEDLFYNHGKVKGLDKASTK